MIFILFIGVARYVFSIYCCFYSYKIISVNYVIVLEKTSNKMQRKMKSTLKVHNPRVIILLLIIMYK